jgi:chromosome partitioning protein
VDNADDSLFSFYFAQRPLTPLVRQGQGGWPVIPAHVELSKVDAQSGKGPQVLNRLNTAIVKENLNTGRPIIMDCCPILGVLSLNAIFAADRILVPVSADWLAVKGVIQVDRTLRALEQHVFKRKLMRRFVITRFDTRRRMSHDIYEQIRGQFGDDVCETRISENVSVAESPAANEDVFTHAPDSRGAQDYDALLDELLESGFIS